jgi:hypothetical protein
LLLQNLQKLLLCAIRLASPGTSKIARVRLHDAHRPGALRVIQTVLSEAERCGCEPECADDDIGSGAAIDAGGS